MSENEEQDGQAGAEREPELSDKAPPIFKKEKKQSKLPPWAEKLFGNEIAVTVFICFILLLGAVFYQQRRRAQEEREIARQISSIKANAEFLKEEVAPVEPEDVPEEEVLLQTVRESDHELKVQFVLGREDKKLRNVIIEMNTPPPPPLTELEIVENKVRAPWLEKVTAELKDIQYKDEAGTFMVLGDAKAFIDYLGTKQRVNSKAVVSGKVDAENMEVASEILINLGFEQPPEEPGFFLRVGEAGDVQFFYKGSVTADKLLVAPPKSGTPAAAEVSGQ